MSKSNEHIKTLLTNDTIEHSTPNCIISQWWNTNGMSKYVYVKQQKIYTTTRQSSKQVTVQCALLNLSQNFAKPSVSFLAAHQLHYTLNILCCSDSPLPSTANLLRNRVRLVNFAQKIFNRTDRPILVKKLFTNAFSAPCLLLANEFDRRFILVR